MIAGFTRRNRPIVATIATGCDATVVVSSRYPGNRQVTIPTVITTLNMIGGFARGLYAVVAGLAGANHRGMVHPGIAPGNLRMAIVAVITAEDMCCIFLGSRDRTGLAVAARTAGRCTSKNPVSMTRLTAKPCMRTI